MHIKMNLLGLVVLLALWMPHGAAAQADTLPAARPVVRHTVAVYPLSLVANFFRLGYQLSVAPRVAVVATGAGGWGDYPTLYGPVGYGRQGSGVPGASRARAFRGWEAEAQARWYFLGQVQNGLYAGLWARTHEVIGTMEFQPSGIFNGNTSAQTVPDGTYRLWGLFVGPNLGYQLVWRRLVLDSHFGVGFGKGRLSVQATYTEGHYLQYQNVLWNPRVMAFQVAFAAGLRIGR